MIVIYSLTEVVLDKSMAAPGALSMFVAHLTEL
jgi:hypothetical protein